MGLSENMWVRFPVPQNVNQSITSIFHVLVLKIRCYWKLGMVVGGLFGLHSEILYIPKRERKKERNDTGIKWAREYISEDLFMTSERSPEKAQRWGWPRWVSVPGSGIITHFLSCQLSCSLHLLQFHTGALVMNFQGIHREGRKDRRVKGTVAIFRDKGSNYC